MSASKNSPHYINPYAEQNARVVGAAGMAEVAYNRPLPGLPSAEGKFYIPLDLAPRSTHRGNGNGWTKVVYKRNRRYRRNGGWVGSDAAAPPATDD